MELGFAGYGGHYTAGKLTQKEIENIIELLARFDERLFLSTIDTVFDTNDFKREYYDFDDVVNLDSVSLPCQITIDSLPTGYKSQMMDSFTSRDVTTLIEDTNVLDDGFYIINSYEQSGNFFNVIIDIDPDEFEHKLLVLECVDLDDYSMSDVVVTNVTYDGKQLVTNTDSYDAEGQSLSQSLLYVKDGSHYDGVEQLRSMINKEYTILTELPDFGMNTSPEVIEQYLEFVEAKNSGYLLDKGYPLAFVSPFLYDNYSKESVDELWMTEQNIKFVLKYDMMDSMPDDVYDRIIGRFPEWLI